MAQYTSFFEERTINIFTEDDCIEELKKVIGKFRSFDEALDSFIVEHGYQGDIKSVEEKVDFISEKCKAQGVPVPRNLKKWYTEHKRMERTTAIPFHICFAFELNVEEVNDFLRRICLSRGFDCHSLEEIVYFYGIKNHLKFKEVEEILSKVPRVKPGKPVCEDLVYTEVIQDEIEAIDSTDELLQFLNENVNQFEYNNVSSYETIQTIFDKILGTKEKPGLAIREKKLLYESFNKEKEAQQYYELTKNRKERKRADDSIWEIYLQILGLSGNYMADFYKERSLKNMLKGNALMHPLAEDSFPDRDGLVKILNGEHVSYERVRKILILFVFYQFYVSRALKNHGYELSEDEAERCIATIDHNLISSNYPTLYPANPYDFLILMAIRTNEPLRTFREYMQELFFESVDLDSFYGENE